MSTRTDTDDVTALLPDDRGNAVFYKPLAEQAKAMQVATVVYTQSHRYLVPVVAENPHASWVAEGAEISESDPKVTTLSVVPAKVAAISRVTAEMAQDSTPQALTLVGRGLTQDIGEQVDRAFFGALPEPAPAGLDALTGITEIDAGTAFANLDPFAAAINNGDTLGAPMTAFVAHPDDALELATLKVATNSNQPLLGPDATSGTGRSILGVPLHASAHVTAGTVWGIPRNRVHVVVRTPAELARSRHAAFHTHEVLLRVISRVGFAFLQAPAIQKITKSA